MVWPSQECENHPDDSLKLLVGARLVVSHLFLPFTFDILHQLRIPNYVEGLFGHILIYSYREYCMYFMEVIDPCLSVLLFFSEFFLESVNDM